MSRLKCEGSFVGMCMNRLALRDVLKESIAAQMDGVNYRAEKSRESAIMHESKEQGQTGEQSQGSLGGVCGSVEVRL